MCNNPGVVTGRQLRAARALLELSQRQLAERAGVARNTLAGIEAGTLDARISTLRRVIKACRTAGSNSS